VLACLNNNSKDINSQIRLTISILKQQILNLNSSIIDLIISNFNKQLKQSLKIKSKLDNFFKKKIVFVFILIKTQKLLNAITIKNISCTIDSRLQLSIFATTIFLSILLFFILLLKRAILFCFYCYRSISLSALLLYFFNRNIYTFIDL